MASLQPTRCRHGIFFDQSGGHRCEDSPEVAPPQIQPQAEARASVPVRARPQHSNGFGAPGVLLDRSTFAANMTLTEWADKIHDWATRKGWWPEGGRNGYEIIALVHTELSEAVEHLREGNFDLDYHEVFYHGADPEYCKCGGGKGCKPNKPDGYAIEMIDAVIRILDDLAEVGADADELMGIKMAYNETRPYRHGGKLA